MGSVRRSGLGIFRGRGMAVGAWAWCGNFFSFILLGLNGLQLIKNVDGANSSKEHLPPPSSLVLVQDRFTLNWTWFPSENIPLDQECYQSMTNKDNKSTQQSKRLWRSEYKGSYPNDTACLKVRAGCVKNDLYGLSSWIRNCTLLSKGDPDTSVTKFACVWYNMDYMNCTWQPGKHTPPDTKYVFYYRYEQLNSDRECPKYIFENQTRIGCHFSKDELCEESKIYLMVTDHSESLRSFYTDVDLYSVLKPSTPRITNLSNISDNEIYVSWTNLWLLNNACLCSQVEVKENALDVGTFSVSKDRSLVILRKYFPDVHYTVRVREKVDELCSASLWSDWSQEESLNETSPVKKGEDSNSGSSLIYLLMILFIVGVATIIFLVHLKRLRFLIFPPIPDPAKLFKGMLEEQNGVWQWTKYSEANVSCKPVKEETYSVFLIENPDSSSSEN